MSLVSSHQSAHLSAHWMPFTHNRQFKLEPRLVASAAGMYYQSTDGRSLLDATSGLWCVNAGHSRPEIVEALQRQSRTLDYAPSFQAGHPIAFEFAHRLAAILPGRLSRIFFTNSGSEAVDTALKIALAYQRSVGQGTRTRLIGRERAYHGVGFGGMSVGGIGANRVGFGPLLPGVDHLRHTHGVTAAFTRGQPASGAELADDLERLVALHGAETIAAVIVEPVAGSTGVLIPPKGYLDRLREITRKHGIVLIFDEVITAFGRLGKASAAELFGVVPDIMALAKGLTNGAVPMGAVAIDEQIHDAIVDAAAPGIELFHGYTCSGHPLAAAAGIATLDLIEHDGLFERALALASVWEEAVHSLRTAPRVKDIRNLGLACGIELDGDPNAPGQLGMHVLRACFEEGLVVRVTGDTIALAPPMIITQEQIGQVVQTLDRVLSRLPEL